MIILRQKEFVKRDPSMTEEQWQSYLNKRKEIAKDLLEERKKSIDSAKNWSFGKDSTVEAQKQSLNRSKEYLKKYEPTRYMTAEEVLREKGTGAIDFDILRKANQPNQHLTVKSTGEKYRDSLNKKLMEEEKNIRETQANLNTYSRIRDSKYTNAINKAKEKAEKARKQIIESGSQPQPNSNPNLTTNKTQTATNRVQGKTGGFIKKAWNGEIGMGKTGNRAAMIGIPILAAGGTALALRKKNKKEE